MTGNLDGIRGQLQVLVIFDWRDGPLEGILRWKSESSCWYFKLFAERPESSILDDRIFGLWEIPDSDGSVLNEEFGDGGDGPVVWPVSGGLGSVEARRIVDGLLSSRTGSPNLIVRTEDFVKVLGVWAVVLD
ncbi:hypothetical protein [Streptomyces sp. NBC_00989]|uniref:hypothetical protein n=1 Tax=Streptomyces sp. NBC_00989 TaxID=2903705 RepID=UPI0038684C68|nr:hypothetical protein OG714_00795 [Streptomyces sp. NBC_00989]WSW98028.1 hypothetical protein OG714_53345 [Streptomyces sp. NBC_00989]